MRRVVLTSELSPIMMGSKHYRRVPGACTPGWLSANTRYRGFGSVPESPARTQTHALLLSADIAVKGYGT